MAFVGGHVQFNRQLFDKFNARYRFITVLRHPVDRFISEYFFNLDREHHAKVTLPLTDYLDTPTARRNAGKLCEYLCGLDVYDPQAAQENAAAAIRNLSCFALIGFTDRMEAFRQGLSRTLGVAVSFGRARAGTTAKSQIENVVTESLRARIEAMCAADIAVYQAARAAHAE